MNTQSTRRISGTYRERFLLNALPAPVLITLLIWFRNGSDSISFLEATLIIGLGSLLIWIVDSGPARQRDPVALIDGPLLQIGGDIVPPNAIHSITPLRIYKGWTRLIKIDYRLAQNNKTAIVLSRPDPFWMIWAKPRTLRLLLHSHPELQPRVQEERTT